MGISLREYKKGMWEYRVTYRDPISNKQRERSKRGFTRKTDARQAAQEIEKQLINNFELASSDMLFKQFLYDWLHEYKKDVVRKNTYELHRRSIEKHIIPYFKSIKLKDIKPTLYQKFLNHLYDQDYSKRTIEIIHGTVRNALEKAYHLNMIERNPTVGAVIKGKNKDKSVKFIDSYDIPIFLKTARNYGYIYWVFYYFMIETGMRKGEAAAIQWTDIDFKKGIININKTLDFQTNHEDELFGDPKTYKSSRTITLRKAVLEKLKFHLKWQNENKTELSDQYKHELNLVFCRNDGSPLPKSSLFNSFRRILKQAGLPPLPIHSLRHTHVVLLLEAGWDMKSIQERVGHGSYQITADVYSHISKRLDEKDMGKFEDHMSSVLDE